MSDTNPDPPPENIIRPHDGIWIPDWVTYRIYNIFDITNSPMREKVLAWYQTRISHNKHNEP